jgi:nitrate/nitrite transport system substrate-binding protein
MNELSTSSPALRRKSQFLNISALWSLPAIVAATQGFGRKHGLTLNLQRQASWATLRDKLLSELTPLIAFTGWSGVH